MKSSKYHALFVAVILSTLLASSAAIPQDDAPAPPPEAPAPAPGGGGSPAAAGAPAAAPVVIILDGTTTESPEEIELETKIVEIKSKQCMMQYGICWAALKARKGHLKEDKRIKICLHRTKQLQICSNFTEDQAKQAKDEMEARLKKSWEEKVEKDEKNKHKKRNNKG